VAILAIQTSSSSIDQGKSALFLWDPTNVNTFYRGPIPLPDPLATSLMNNNGRLYIWSGNAVSGCRLSEYIGGDSISEIAFIEDGHPPLAGACEANGPRIMWGQGLSDLGSYACVMAYGSKNGKLNKALHNIAKSSSTGSVAICTALKSVQQGSVTSKLLIGWGDQG
jgi:hypothetical protein